MKITLVVLMLIVFNQNKAQTVLLSEDFESYSNFAISNIGDWQLLDLDQLNTTITIGGDPAPPVNWRAAWPNAGAKMAFQIFNFSQSNASNDFTGATGDFRNFNPHSGQKYAASWAGQMVQSYKGNDDWLITPAVTLGLAENQISMYLKSLSNSYGDERYQIGVYVGSGTPTSNADFTIINTLPYEFATYNININDNWKIHTYNLDSYAGQTIRVGIHCVTQEASALLIDDVKITTATNGTLSAASLNKNKISKIYPNPSNGEFSVRTLSDFTSLDILDSSGKIILTTQSVHLNISEQPLGYYFLKINYKDGRNEVQKIVKNK